MQKSTIYFISLIIICLTAVALGGEYFMYKYYSLSISTTTKQTINQDTNNNIKDNNQNPQGTGSSDNSIISFGFTNPTAIGTIYQSSHTIAITVPPITDITKLAPVIEISPNATVSPQSGSIQDFTSPVTYTVTAQNGSTQTYTVTVKVASIMTSIGRSIKSFKLAGLTPVVAGTIDNTRHTVNIIVPDGTDLTNLMPTITVSDSAIISPQSGVAQDFTNPVIYTVTDMYGGQQDYTVTIVNESNSG